MLSEPQFPGSTSGLHPPSHVLVLCTGLGVSLECLTLHLASGFTAIVLSDPRKDAQVKKLQPEVDPAKRPHSLEA